MGFRYFARGTVASHGYARITRVGRPVEIRGLPVAPGDLLHGDENGLITVPREGLDELPEAVEKVRAREKSLMEFVRGAGFTFEGLRGRLLE
jgi:regulator of RNase E activity RraA